MTAKQEDDLRPLAKQAIKAVWDVFLMCAFVFSSTFVLGAALLLLIATAVYAQAQPTAVGSAIETDYYRCEKVDDHTIQCVPITKECLALRSPELRAQKRATDHDLRMAAPKDPLCWSSTLGRVERLR